MSKNTRDEYLLKMRRRYGRMAGKRARTVLVDEFCEVSGHERKYAARLLGGRRGAAAGKRGRGRPPLYGEAELRVIKAVWKACEQPCGKRLKPALALWIGAYERREGALEEGVRRRVLKVSPAQLDRLLLASKISGGARYRPGLKANAAVKAVVPVRAESWDTNEAGWTEADTVALCGGSMGGEFASALPCTDIATGWTEARATWNWHEGSHPNDTKLRRFAGLPRL